jgi:2-polyprenyl-6-hydroxyphenyl methylase/3-demethylubiquinone-9 3-methyltransferase
LTVSAREEIVRGQRFAFGANWRRFLSVLNDTRIRDSEAALCTLLEVSDLRGKSFLDIGSGSGLSSLAARRLGAVVTSFDYDPQSVECTRELRRRYFPDDAQWHVEPGSVLDADYIRSRGQFDVVYSWGVLHHTGDMWRALANAARPVVPGGHLCIAIYNDQGATSRRWHRVKRLYCSSLFGRVLVCAAFIPYFVGSSLASDVWRRRNPFRRYLQPTGRGMSVFYDWFDWLGGLPFEVAKPEAILRFYRDRGFALRNLVTAGGQLGNNEFVFRRT